ncbi:hypothetical protein CYY_009105 [Polysphondylium violaceum]|uniref:Uncharacterized protein n=1 Tax=Polysphondylium violaceum TaxID=133409 RepID=A0A8J4PM39_9MYCE|nr:hypothetical protein CYY_009105 [Polysphondylium violaceum]
MKIRDIEIIVEGKNFYPGSYTQDTRLKEEDDHEVKQHQIKEHSRNNSADLFMHIYRNITIKRHIFSFIHRDLVPFYKYSDIHSLRWILNYGSTQLFVDKVKRNEYLSDILYLSNRLNTFKSINDIEFYTIFKHRYRRYLLDTTMTNVRTFLDTIFNNNKDNNIIENINDNSNKQPIDINELGVKALIEDFKNNREKTAYYLKRALESKHFLLAKYVVDEWLVNNNENDKQTILNDLKGYVLYMVDKEIIQYFCNNIETNNRNHLTIGIEGILYHDDFEEIMKLLEKSGMVNKNDTKYSQNHSKTKRVMKYFIENGYKYNLLFTSIFSTITYGTDDQFAGLSLVLDHFEYTDHDLDCLVNYSDRKRSHLIFGEIFKRFTIDQVREQYPKTYENYQYYKSMYNEFYSPNPKSSDNQQSLPPQEQYQIQKTVTYLCRGGVMSCIRRLVGKYQNDSNMLTIIFNEIFRHSHLHVLKMLVNEYRHVIDGYFSQTKINDLFTLLGTGKQESVSLEIFDFLIDKLRFLPSKYFFKLDKIQNILLASYFACKVPPQQQTPCISKEDIIDYQKKSFLPPLTLYKM